MDDDVFDHYQHTPLSKPDELRIIVLYLSSILTSPISCGLIHSTLHHYGNSIINHYAALSYGKHTFPEHLEQYSPSLSFSRVINVPKLSEISPLPPLSSA